MSLVTKTVSLLRKTGQVFLKYLSSCIHLNYLLTTSQNNKLTTYSFCHLLLFPSIGKSIYKLCIQIFRIFYSCPQDDAPETSPHDCNTSSKIQWLCNAALKRRPGDHEFCTFSEKVSLFTNATSNAIIRNGLIKLAVNTSSNTSVC